jgi:hypothetical protein
MPDSKRSVLHMKQIPAIWFAFFGFVTFGQAEASDKDYLFQTINIFETKVLNELAKYSSNSDSIQLLAGFTVYGGLDVESAFLFGSLYGKVRKE